MTCKDCVHCDICYARQLGGEITENAEICKKFADKSRFSEQKHGVWLKEFEPNGKLYCFHCSMCDSDFHHIGITTIYDYCPLCGAKMNGKED